LSVCTVKCRFKKYIKTGGLWVLSVKKSILTKYDSAQIHSLAGFAFSFNIFIPPIIHARE